MTVLVQDYYQAKLITPQVVTPIEAIDIFAKFSNDEFKRSYGIKKETATYLWQLILAQVKLAKPEWLARRRLRGRPYCLSLDTELLLTIHYWREYRSFYHLGKAYGISEATAYRIVRRIEDLLMKSGKLKLRSKRVLLEDQEAIDHVIIADTTECLIQRPQRKKNSKTVTQGKKNGIP